MCKISIVLPVYNGEKYLARAVESILFQEYQQWELIIVNDFSEDGSLAIAEHFASFDSRIRIISNRKNEKLPESLNIGFRAAKGEYLTWTSDDNYYEKEALGIMAHYLDAHKEAGMVYCDMKLESGTGESLGTASHEDTDRIVLYNVIGACFLYRREVMDKIGEYHADLFLVEDYDYWLRIYKNYQIVHISESPYHYCKNDGSLTSSRLQEIKAKTVLLRCSYLKDFGSKLTKRQIRKLYCEAAAHGCDIREWKQVFQKADPLFAPVYGSAFLYKLLNFFINR